MASRRAPLPGGRDGRAATRHAAETGLARSSALFTASSALALRARFVGLPLERLAREVDDLVLTIAAGAGRKRGLSSPTSKPLDGMTPAPWQFGCHLMLVD